MAAPRSPGVDAARAAAVLLMIQAHAYHAYASAAARTTWAYALTRELAAVPAPLFLLLAGAGLGLAPGKGVSARVRRGLLLVLTGYLVNLAYALLEGPSALRAEVLLRADILHAIGLSLCVCAPLPGRPRLAAAVAALSLVPGLLLPLLPGLPRSALPPPLAAPLALLVDIPGYTRFPLLPLCGFCALGVPVGAWLRSPPSPRRLYALAAFCALLALLAALATAATLALVPGPLSRGHLAVVPNFLDGAARALCVLFLCLALLPPGTAAAAAAPLAWLGRRSLSAYALHLPLCYSWLASPLKGRLSMAQATFAYAALVLVVAGLLSLLDRVKALLVRGPAAE